MAISADGFIIEPSFEERDLIWHLKAIEKGYPELGAKKANSFLPMKESQLCYAI